MVRKVCAITGEEFTFLPGEAELYKKLNLPEPDISPAQRARMRLAWRNERTLYRRPCDATGKLIVSIFDKNAPFPVFEQQYWWSDNYDPLKYGRPFDFSRTFFEQFHELFMSVPQVALLCPQSENCEYTNQAEKNKDCYLCFCTGTSQECMYGMWYQSCINCVDCTYLEKCELCYEILNAKSCYECSYSQNLQNCSQCHYSRDLIGCTNCFGCVKLRNQSNCYFNEQLSPEAYQQQVKNLDLDSYAQRQSLLQKSNDFWKKWPQKFYNGKNNEDSSGDYIENTKQAHWCFNCRNSEHIYYCRDAWSARFSADLTETLEQDFCIQLEGAYKNVNSGFCSKITEVHDAWYSSHCHNSHDVFGCIGLKHHAYCILNTEYKADEFKKLRSKLIAHMRETGEWGKYFPIQLAPFAYNESVAQEYFPMTKEEVVAAGISWKEESNSLSAPKENVHFPERISSASDEILAKVLICESTKKPFQLQKSELDFYKKLSLPIPRIHHNKRHLLRMSRRNPRELWSRACDACLAPMLSSVPASSPAQIVCEKCYGEA